MAERATTSQKTSTQSPKAGDDSRVRDAGLEHAPLTEHIRRGSLVPVLASELRAGRLTAAQQAALVRQLGPVLGNQSVQRIVSPPLPRRVRPSPLRPSAATPAAIQRVPLRLAPHTPIGTIVFYTSELGTAEALLRFAEELVPPGSATPFGGTEHQSLAFSQAWRQEDAICAVVTDREGRFHALRTDWHGYTVRERSAQQITLHRRPIPGVSDVRWVNVPTERRQGAETGPGSWRERVDRAQRWLPAFRETRVHEEFPASCPHQPQHRVSDFETFKSCLQAQFVSLLAEALGITTNEIHVASERFDRDPNALVTFDIYETSRGRAGVRGPGEQRAMPTTSRESVPQPAWAVGPGAFDSQSRLQTLATAVHETEHVAHSARYLELFRVYQRSGSRQTFSAWIERRHGISDADRQLILEAARRARFPEAESEEEQRRRGANTETMAYAEGFIASYHGFRTGSTLRELNQLHQCARHWVLASDPVKEEVLRRLIAYIDSGRLGRTHLEALRAQVTRFVTSSSQQAFWTRLSPSIERQLSGSPS